MTTSTSTSTSAGAQASTGVQAAIFPARARNGMSGNVALLIAPTQFLLFEAITAAAWKSPRYSYFHNFISDLGVTNGPTTYQGRPVDSPLGLLIDVSFCLLGVIGAYGILTLSRSLPRSSHRTWIRIAGVAFGLGGLMVGLFPENTIELAHATGAFLNIGFGNVVLILVGARGTHYYATTPRLARLLVGLGVLGSVAMIALVAVPALFNGAVERTAAYPYMVSLVLLGSTALSRTRAHRLAQVQD